MRGGKAHWQEVYETREPDAVSWYEPVPEDSLELIEASGIDPGAAVVDIGGGASGLCRELLRRSFTDLTVADIAPAALDRAREALGAAAGEVTWVEADVRVHDFGRTFDLWHDRALFHFMVEPGDRAAYLAALRRGVAPGGFAVLSTFGPDGPTRCSGLPTARYGEPELSALLAPDLEPVASFLRDHETPGGSTQQFLFGLWRSG